MYKFINDRSNLDDVVCIIPSTHPDNHTGNTIQLTRREDLKREASWPRTDIVLISGTRSEKQYILDVTANGFSGDLWILDILTEEEYDRVQDIATRMRTNARSFEPAGKLLVGA